MFCSQKAAASVARCSLIALLASLTTLQASATDEPGAKAPKHTQHRRKPALSPAQIAPNLPVPIPRMTLEELPTQPPRITYSQDQLTLDSDNTTLTEALAAIRDKTSLQIDPMPETGEHFTAHFSGTPREVIAQLLSGSGFGYILVASRTDPAALDKLILTKLALSLTADTRTVATSPVPTPPRAAAFIPPDVAERRGESLPDTTAKAPSAEEAAQAVPNLPQPTPTLPVETQSTITTPDGSTTPANTNAAPSGTTQDRKQISPAGQYMQELYRMRLQQQTQLSNTAPASPP